MISVKRLDTLLQEHGFPRIDVLIVDVEGAELGVLRSVFPCSQTVGPVTFCELHCNEWPMFGHSADDFSTFLQSQGLTCVDTYLEEHVEFKGKKYLGPCVLRKR
ncbi:MAG: FkbM family methyltransferase [Verrucomicrobia bacterium]|nr:FkbM family methyltransferase [Verrucomicrobiota bacterium]